MESHLEELLLPATFLTGFHGYMLGLKATTPHTVRSDGSHEYVHFNAIGCTLSHLMALRIALDSGAPSFIVLEDDAELAPDFADRLPQVLSGLPPEINILNLELFETDRSKPSTEVNAQCLRIYWPFGSAGIWWRRDAAQLAIQHLHPISHPYDICLMNLVYPFCQLAVSRIPLVRQRSARGAWPSAVQVEPPTAH